MSLRRSVISALVVVATAWLLAVRVGLFRIRLATGRLVVAAPDRLVPRHASVLPPPAAEYVGVWAVDPESARETLKSRGFSQLFRAYLHGYERDGQIVHEIGSYVYRPDGLLSRNQLHVRLFPTDEGHTEVWAHWEANPNRTPRAHLNKVGYDPAEGARRLRAMLADEPLSKPDTPQRPPFLDE